VQDVSVAGWVAGRLSGFGSGRVDSVVPAGFASYARILHPVPGPDGQPTTWAAVCAAHGATAHPLMQWNSIAGVVDGTDHGFTTRTMRWPGGPPEEGNLCAPALPALLTVLAAQTSGVDLCLFALWEGYGQVWTGAWPRPARFEPGHEPVPAAEVILAGPRLHHPSRDYLLFAGPLPAAAGIGHRWDPHWTQSPNLFWPADQSWCVASEIDFDSTLIGGTAALVDAVLAEPALEAWRVDPGDSLAHNADTINT